MQKLSFFIALLTVAVMGFAQPGQGYVQNYQPLHSGNIMVDKDFYLITTILHSPEMQSVFDADDSLAGILKARISLIQSHVSDTCGTPETLLNDFRWSYLDTMHVNEAIRRCYTQKQAVFDQMINRQLRPSGYYQRFIVFSNLDLLLQAWGQYVVGINYIIDQYGRGRRMRYPTIDSVSYDVQGQYYRDLLKTMFSYLREKTDSMKFFFQPSLAVALQLMRANDRDEPLRFEPLETGENKLAVARVGLTDWNRYRYEAILVPGEGPEVVTVPFGPICRMRCDLAADRYRKGLAPFIIVSGGFCHPFHTPYCEAIEMKKYLLQECKIPETAVIIEPQARHTTTNFRNACRQMIRYGMPVSKACLCVTTKDQADYIDGQSFEARCQHELGYLPYRDLQRMSDHDIVFFPVMDCLHLDPYDPLDP